MLITPIEFANRIRKELLSELLDAEFDNDICYTVGRLYLDKYYSKLVGKLPGGRSIEVPDESPN